MSDVLVVTSKVKGRVKQMYPDFRVSADAIEGLSEAVGEIVTEAARVANEAGRKTVKKRDVRDAIKNLKERE